MKLLVSVLALSVSLVSIAFGQEKIKGIVKDDTGVPVPGATVIIKGTSNYAVTDEKGEFVLASAKEYPFSIQFNLVGWIQVARSSLSLFSPFFLIKSIRWIIDLDIAQSAAAGVCKTP